MRLARPFSWGCSGGRNFEAQICRSRSYLSVAGCGTGGPVRGASNTHTQSPTVGVSYTTHTRDPSRTKDGWRTPGGREKLCQETKGRRSMLVVVLETIRSFRRMMKRKNQRNLEVSYPPRSPRTGRRGTRSYRSTSGPLRSVAQHHEAASAARLTPQSAQRLSLRARSLRCYLSVSLLVL